MIPELDAGESAELQVRVTGQDEDGGSRTESAVLTIDGLAELSVMAGLSPVELATDELHERYSYISLIGPLRLVGTEPVVLRSTGDFRTGDITILDASGGSASSGGPGLCAELGYGSSIANGTEAGPGGCAGGQPGSPAVCTSTGDPSAPLVAVMPVDAHGGGGGDGGAQADGGTGGGGGGVVRIDAGRLVVPGQLQVTVDGASGCPPSVGDDHGAAGDGGAIWIRARQDFVFTEDHGFSALPGFADRELFEQPGQPGRYRVDLPRQLVATEGARFFSSERSLGEHPLAAAPGSTSAFAASLFQGPVVVTSGIVFEPAVEMVGGQGAGVDLVVDGEVVTTTAGARQTVELEIEPGLHQVCAVVAGGWAVVGAEGSDCRSLAYLRR
jgi:hypothetical protein